MENVVDGSKVSFAEIKTFLGEKRSLNFFFTCMSDFSPIAIQAIELSKF